MLYGGRFNFWNAFCITRGAFLEVGSNAHVGGEGKRVKIIRVERLRFKWYIETNIIFKKIII